MMFVVISVGMFATLAMMVLAFSGPSTGKAAKRRMQTIKERHGDIVAGKAEAQIRKLMAQRSAKLDGLANSLLPKPALLRRRLEQTGKSISLAPFDKRAMPSLQQEIQRPPVSKQELVHAEAPTS